mmetsp:Transcript_25484/g.33295  ORF Transcript_25484/g.33295 Transcript_25484/m.33295 type:complete len:84 (+) Transcript_25484:30-281(+)
MTCFFTTRIGKKEMGMYYDLYCTLVSTVGENPRKYYKEECNIQATHHKNTFYCYTTTIKNNSKKKDVTIQTAHFFKVWIILSW